MIRFGILGTARIARAFFELPLNGVSITAVASRDKEKGEAFVRTFGIPRRYGNYDDLLGDPDIDAVYIPLPQHLHCEYGVKAARAKKHILMEKPAALNVAELRSILTACDEHNVLFMEAFMYRFMRVHNRAKEIARQGTIGRLRQIDFNWCFNSLHRWVGTFRSQRELGGGALLDLGIYGADFIRFITEGSPKLLSAHMQRKEGDGIDQYTHAVYSIDDVLATMSCGFDRDANYYVLSGEEGSVFAPISLSGRTAPNILRVHLVQDDKRYEEQFPAENPYKLEMEYFARCIERNEQPFLGGENSLRNAELLDELFATAVVL